MKIIIFINLSLILSVYCKTIEVKTASDLHKAISEAAPGDTINLADGKYHETFTAEKSGTSGSPITLKGSKNAVISGPNYGFWLKANYWVLSGFTVTDANKGIVLDGANHNILEHLTVHNIKDEGVHFRLNSADNILRDSEITNTGTGNAGFGEGVYIGSAVKNWKGGPDKSDRNQVLNNKIGPNVAAECIDIKEGSCCGIIRGNTFDGNGMSGQHFAESWVDIKGESYTIEDNTGNKSFKHGFKIEHIAEAKMGSCHNTIQNNKCNGLPSGGKCIEDAYTASGCDNVLKNNA